MVESESEMVKTLKKKQKKTLRSYNPKQSHACLMRAHGLTQMVVETNQCHSEQTTILGNAPETENNEIFFSDQLAF